MTIDGRDTFVYSATFHYFRTPRELWRDRFAKIKDAGFNAVETYVPWNWHEREMPKGLDDFSQVDLTDIRDWLKMAQDEFGFYTIVRPGPFICAEWAGGGYPRWLAKFGPGEGGLWLRSGADSHIAWSIHWYEAVCRLFAGEQITRKPKGGKGIILVQIENEYNHHSDPGKTKVLKALYQAVVKAGVEVPVFTCATNETRGSKDPELSRVFDCDNYYVGLADAPGCAHRMAGLRKQQPNAPGFVTELQGGWFSLVGGGMSEDHYSDARHFNAISWMSILGGATGLEPYVFVGGTHFDGWGARGMTTTYDYNAAIRESGALGPKFHVAKSIGDFIRDHGAMIARSEGGPCELQGAPKNVFGGLRVSRDGTRFVFLTNTDARSPVSGKLTVMPGKIVRPAGPIYNINQYGEKVLIQPAGGDAGSFEIAPFEVSYRLSDLGAGVLVIPPGMKPDEGTWYPKPAQIQAAADLPQPVRLVEARKAAEPLTGAWKPVPSGKSLPELGISDHRYVLYRASVKLSTDEVGNLNRLLVNSFSRDIVAAMVNGKVAARLAPSEEYAAAITRDSGKSFKRIGPDEYDNVFDVAGLLKAGSTNEVLFIYENIGHEHGYVPMEELSGIRQAGFSVDGKSMAKRLDLEFAPDLGGISQGWTQPGFDAGKWELVTLDTTSGIPGRGKVPFDKVSADSLMTWYRMEFTLPEQAVGAAVPWMLRLIASGNGNMWLNGHNIGRHYEVGPQREFYLPECWLKFGKAGRNVVVLGLRGTMHGAALKAAEVAPYPPQKAPPRAVQ